MSEREWNGAVTAKIGNPVPSKDAFYADDIVGSVQRYDMLKALWSGRHVLVIEDGTDIIHNADIHSSCVQVNTGVELMLFFIEFHKGPPVEDLVYPYYRAFMSINCFKLIVDGTFGQKNMNKYKYKFVIEDM